LSAACSRVPPGGETGLGLNGATPADGSGPAGANGPEGSGAGTAIADGRASGGVDAAPIKAAGARTGSGVPTLKAGGYGPGVDPVAHTISVVIPIKAENCGPDSNTAKAGVVNDKGKLVIQTYVDFMNKDVLGPSGWKIKYQYVDDGGLYCPEKAKAAALKITKEIKPFAVLGGSVPLSGGPIIADQVTKAGIVHIGYSWATYDEFQKRHPYAWEIGPVGQKSYEYLADFMAKRVVGTKAADAATGVESSRVYGLLAVDDPGVRKLGAFMKQRLAAIGIDLAHIYYVSPDPGVAAQASTTTVQKMKADGVNTLLFDFASTVNAAQAGIVYTSAMNSQNYLPDILTPSSGIAFFDRLYDPRVWARARGTSAAGTVTLRNAVRVNPETHATEADPRYVNVNENSVGYDDVWRRSGQNTAAQDSSVPAAFDTWNTLAVLVLGVTHAGARLDVKTWSDGLQSTARGGASRCSSWRMVGRDYEYNAFYNFDDKHDGGREGYTTIYWVNKQSELGTNGYYESYDGYRYFSGPDLPDKASYDTAQTPDYAPPRQAPIGLHPWVTCASLGRVD
jgi:hypothetical protein